MVLKFIWKFKDRKTFLKKNEVVELTFLHTKHFRQCGVGIKIDTSPIKWKLKNPRIDPFI